MRWQLALFSILAAAVGTTATHQARACDPVPPYTAKIGTEDAPDCMQVRGDSFDEGVIGLTNTCDYEITISPGADCPHCAAAHILGGNDTVEFLYVVETDHKSAKRTVQWTSPQGTGTIAVELTYREVDPDDTCEDEGCTASPSGLRNGEGLRAASVLVAGVALACARRARRARRG